MCICFTLENRGPDDEDDDSRHWLCLCCVPGAVLQSVQICVFIPSNRHARLSPVIAMLWVCKRKLKLNSSPPVTQRGSGSSLCRVARGPLLRNHVAGSSQSGVPPAAAAAPRTLSEMQSRAPSQTCGVRLSGTAPSTVVFIRPQAGSSAPRLCCSRSRCQHLWAHIRGSDSALCLHLTVESPPRLLPSRFPPFSNRIFSAVLQLPC